MTDTASTSHAIDRAPGCVTVTVDGRTVDVPEGELMIQAAERAGVYIPRFCYHPRLAPVGMCRMCLVQVQGPPGRLILEPSCFKKVADGMVIMTQNTSPAAKKAQEGVLEFLLLNHPLDCPVCDRGGECPLQDQTMAHGPGETRMVEEKRHWEKPIPLSDLVLLDRERCIQCARCTRFAEEIAGDPLIDFVERGGHTEVNTFPGEPFASYFSGNTVQICPVGALTATPYRFKARPWDLEQVESTCTSCAVGCRIAVQSSTNRLTRYLGLDSDPVNQGWLCDKGRFDFESVNHEARLASPLVRKGDQLVEVGWAEALDAAARGLGDAASIHGAAAVAVIGGARLANEGAYAWAKLAKSVLGTDSVDAQLGDGLPAELVLGLPRATIDDACAASAVVLLGPDLKEELPVLYLRLRSAAVHGDTRLVELTPAPTGLTRYAAATLGHRPGEAAAAARALTGGPADDTGGVAADAVERARGVVGSGDGVVVVIGRSSLAESADGVAEAAAVLAAAWPGAKFLPALRRANVHGALDMGLAPGVLPGRVTLDDGRDWYTAAWGKVPAARGHDTAGILTEAAEGRIQGLVLLGADPLADFPDRELARRGLAGAGFVVTVDTLPTESARTADVVLPAAMFAETAGTTTNLEGRVSRLGQKITPPGVAWPDWMIASELAARLGADLGFSTLTEVWDEIERLAPSHAGITPTVLGAARLRDGVLAPLPDELPVLAEHLGDVTQGFDIPQDTEPAAVLPDSAEESQQVAGAEAEAEAEAAPVGPARPATLTYTAPPAAAKLPPRDAYALRLVVSRTMYDHGTLVQHSPSLAGLAPGLLLRANPYDLDRVGAGKGGQVQVRTTRASLVVETAPDPGMPRGSAWLAFNAGTPGAADLIDATATVIDVRVESTS
ncbi:MAG TPA: NADH-quinone oxidoreductase subunit NuoG [Acidimicrobiales bacterium]|nr:NADH-quinone oxidoreductase subunit NuoG [Acidimicrobiales bacterium]